MPRVSLGAPVRPVQRPANVAILNSNQKAPIPAPITTNPIDAVIFVLLVSFPEFPDSWFIESTLFTTR